MLKLKPCCEHCERALPPDSREARICSFECTFCATCVYDVLKNVCPNCGGGFERRPVRPAIAHVGSASLRHHPATATRTIKPVDATTQQALIEQLATVAPAKR